MISYLKIHKEVAKEANKSRSGLVVPRLHPMNAGLWV